MIKKISYFYLLFLISIITLNFIKTLRQPKKRGNDFDLPKDDEPTKGVGSVKKGEKAVAAYVVSDGGEDDPWKDIVECDNVMKILLRNVKIDAKIIIYHIAIVYNGLVEILLDVNVDTRRNAINPIRFNLNGKKTLLENKISLN